MADPTWWPTALSLKSNRLSTAGVEQLFVNLLEAEAGEFVVELDLSDNEGLGPTVIQAIADFVSLGECRLKVLNLERVGLGPTGGMALAKLLNETAASLFSFRDIRCSSNALDDETVRALQGAVARHHQLIIHVEELPGVLSNTTMDAWRATMQVSTVDSSNSTSCTTPYCVQVCIVCSLTLNRPSSYSLFSHTTGTVPCSGIDDFRR